MVLVLSLPSASQGKLECNIFPPHVFRSLSLPLAQALQPGLWRAVSVRCWEVAEQGVRPSTQHQRNPARQRPCSQSERKALWTQYLIFSHLHSKYWIAQAFCRYPPRDRGSLASVTKCTCQDWFTKGIFFPWHCSMPSSLITVFLPLQCVFSFS